MRYQIAILKYIFAFILGLIYMQPLSAQIDKDDRPEEKEVLLEKLFIDAMREKILGNYEAAIARYQEVVQKDNENHVANFQLADLYKSLEQYDKSMVRAARALELDEENITYTDFYAQLLAKMGRYKDAADLYEQLSKHFPQKEYIYYEWAHYLIKANQKNQAIKVYNSLEKELGLRPKLSIQKFKLYASMQKTKKAIKELEALMEAFPEEVEYVVMLADFFKSIEKGSDAQRYYEKALKVDPHHPQANIAMAEVFRQEGDTMRYINALQAVFEDEKQPPLAKQRVLEPLAQQAIQQNNKERLAKVTNLAKAFAESHPTYAYSHAIYGHLLSADKQYKAALREYEVALDEDKNQIEVWKQLLKIYSLLSQNQKLLKTAEDFVALYPSQAIGHYYLGLSYNRKGDYVKGQSSLKRAKSMAVDNQELKAYAYAALGESLSGQKDYSNADLAFDEAISLLPENLEVQHSYCRSLLQRNEKLSKAEELIKRLRKIDPDNINYQATEAWYLYRKGDYKASKKAFENAMNNGASRDALLVERYGDCLFKLDQAEKALEQWQQARDLGNNSSILERKIETKQLYE
jgi:tetratricopeptide (TPR) repeat protein